MRNNKFIQFIIITVCSVCILGCATPCKQFAKANWHCNLEVVDPVSPGDLIYISEGDFGKIKLPDKIAGFNINTDNSSVANETKESNWTFGLKAGLKGIPSIGSVSEPEAKLSAAGFKKISFIYTDTKVKSLVTPEGGSGTEIIIRARELADTWIDALTPVNRNKIGNTTPPDGTVWLVMQTLESKVVGTLSGKSDLSATAGAVINGIAANITGSVVNTSSYTISITNSLPIAYRAIPLAISGNGGEGLQSATEIKIKHDKLGGPSR